MLEGRKCGGGESVRRKKCWKEGSVGRKEVLGRKNCWEKESVGRKKVWKGYSVGGEDHSHVNSLINML